VVVVEAGSELDRSLGEAAGRSVEGWDFSWLGARLTTSGPAWDYTGLVLARVGCRAAGLDLLDLGTGGGEWLAALPRRPPRTVATESWPPNVPVAADRLRPFGVPVLWTEGAPDNAGQRLDERRGRLPVRSGVCHLVAARHESFLAAEVARVLAPGGQFVTQQVGDAGADLRGLLGLPPAPPPVWTVQVAAAQLAAAGLVVTDTGDGDQVLTFGDVGALAWYLRAAPWVVPGFTVAAFADALARVQQRIDTEGPVSVRQPVFWLAADRR
jgi:SAM-dependent methyltransferase